MSQEYVVRLECKLDDKNAILPTRARTTDAGYDLYTITEHTLNPQETYRFETGLRIAAPNGWYYTIEGRSSLWTQGIVPFRGIIDGGYTGLVSVRLMNLSTVPYSIKKYDRIAQLVLHRVCHADIIVVEEFSPEYNCRGTAGFGSSGR